MTHTLPRKELLWISFLTLTPLILSALYSILNTDPHHWGFILGTALEAIRGNSFFTDVYIQYGVGQSLLYRFLSFFFPINYTSLGFITSVFYSLNLLILYLSVKRISSFSIAVLISSTVLLIHSYAIYPWPDYYAGHFLALACYSLLDKNTENKISSSYLRGGFFLFLAFLFRNTYLLSILASTLGLLVLMLFNQKVREKKPLQALAVFYGLIGTYFGFLFMQGTLRLWFEQTIGAGNTQYGIGFSAIFILLQRAFLPQRFYLPNNLVYTTVSVLLYASLLVVLSVLFKRKFLEKLQTHIQPGVLAFFALLGLAGLAQSTLGYEVFRIQNACSPIYLVFAALLAAKFPNFDVQLKKRSLKFGLGVYFILLLVKFPNASSIFPLYDGSIREYAKSNIPLFQWHRFRTEELAYYEGLSKLLCNESEAKKILNLTMDSNLPYLCPQKENAFKLSFYHEGILSKISPERLAQQKAGEYFADELVIAEIEDPAIKKAQSKLIEMGRVVRPPSMRFLGTTPVVVFRVEEAKN